MGPFDMMPMIAAAAASAEATDRLAAAIDRLAQATERANELAELGAMPLGLRQIREVPQ